MLTCRDIHGLGDSCLDGSLPWRRRLSLRLHTLLCVHCRRYLRQLSVLLKAFAHAHPAASTEEVDRVMGRLREEGMDSGGKNL